tara:strand:- start:171 stop:869 length:699 start_codon:yes stop_codon:yes gene_type:complete
MAIGNPITLTNNVASKNISVTATADQTLFTVTGGYRINQLAVFRNGVRLVDGSDFTARDGSTVTLVTAANLNDTIEFQIFEDFRVADAIVTAETTQTISGELNVTGGVNIGIQSGGTDIATGVITAINFIGAGNTAVYDTVSKTVDISISGSGGGGLGTAINYADDATATPFSYIDREATVSENLMLDTTKAGESESIIVSVIPNITLNAGVAVTVGTGKTMIIDVLQIGDL